MEALSIVSDIVRRVYFFFLEHDECGGVAVDFVVTLDGLVFKYLPIIRAGARDSLDRKLVPTAGDRHLASTTALFYQ